MEATTPTSLVILCVCATLGLLAPPGAATTEYVLCSNPSTVLLPGQNLSYDLNPEGIPYGPALLVLQNDCNLVAYYQGRQTWASNTTGAGDNCYLSLNSTGQVVLQRNYHYPVWASPKPQNKVGDYVFVLQWNGGLGIYGPNIWSSPNKEELGDPELTGTTTNYVIHSGTVLPIGLAAKYKDLELTLQQDCNLVLRRTSTGKVMWQSHKYSDSRDCFFTIDAYGELFVKHKRREILWRSNTRSELGLYVFVLGFDARLAVYGPQVWTTVPISERGQAY